MVSRKPADRKFLDLQTAESATAWIMLFVAKCCIGRKMTRSTPMRSRQLADKKFWIYRMQNQLLHGLGFLWLNVAHRRERTRSTPMVFRQPAYQKFLNLQNAKSATAWIMSFVAKCCVEKKKDKINTTGIQKASRQKNSESTERRIGQYVDYVFCG